MQRIVIAALLALTVWAYWPVLSAGFVYEDEVYVSRAATPTDRVIPIAPRAFTEWTFRANYFATKDKPCSYHALNLALHLCVGVCLGLVSRRLGLSRWVSIGVMGLFWLHPLNTQAVSYVAGRADLIAALGVLLALYAATGGPLSGQRLTLIALGLGLACGGKEFGLMGAGVVALYWWHLRRPWAPTTRTVLVCLAFAVFVVAPLLYFRLLHGNEYTGASERNGLGYMAVQSGAVWRYLGMLVWPVGLTIDHDFDLLPPSVAFGCLAALIVSVVIAWRGSARHSLIGFGFLSALIVLIPRFLVRIPEYLNEHQFYLSMVFLCLALGGVAQSIHARYLES